MRTSGRAVAEEGPEQERECLIVRRKKKKQKRKEISQPLGHIRFSGVLAAFPVYLKSRAISFSRLVASWAFIQESKSAIEVLPYL